MVRRRTNHHGRETTASIDRVVRGRPEDQRAGGIGSEHQPSRTWATLGPQVSGQPRTTTVSRGYRPVVGAGSGSIVLSQSGLHFAFTRQGPPRSGIGAGRLA